MKKFFFLFLGLSLLLSSCSTDAAEKVADDFHEHLDKGDVDYIMDNLIYLEETGPEGIQEFRLALESLGLQGEQTNRQKETGFNKAYNNGVTTVKLSYTYEVQDTKVYERLVLIETDEGYKILMFIMHPDEAVAEEYTSQY
jgi:hypothetical protein